MGDTTESEFVDRFVAHVLKTCGIAQFDDGESAEEYARKVAPSYWTDIDLREEGPETCAEVEMDYWGED